MSRGYFFVFLAAVLWGSTAAVTKLMLAQLDNLQVLMVTTLVATLTLGAVTIVQGKASVLLSHSPREYLTLAFLGFIGILAYQFLLQGAILLMPAQEAFVVNYTWPIMVVLFAALILHERLALRDIAAVLASFAGVVLVVTRGNFSGLAFSAIGILMALGAAAAYGLFSVLGKGKDREPVTSMVVYSATSFLCALLAVLAFSHLPSLSFAQMAGLIWLGAGPYGLAYVFWFLALRNGSTAGMSSAIFVTPFLSAVYVFFLLGEPMAWSSIVGLVVIIGGILFRAGGRSGHSMETETA